MAPYHALAGGSYCRHAAREFRETETREGITIQFQRFVQLASCCVFSVAYYNQFILRQSPRSVGGLGVPVGVTLLVARDGAALADVRNEGHVGADLVRVRVRVRVSVRVRVRVRVRTRRRPSGIAAGARA